MLQTCTVTSSLGEEEMGETRVLSATNVHGAPWPWQNAVWLVSVYLCSMMWAVSVPQAEISVENSKPEWQVVPK